MKISNFRGVSIRNALPASGPRYRESAIVNLDDANDVVYFDSFGELQPPIELMIYLGVDQIKYNPERYQDFDIQLWSPMSEILEQNALDYISKLTAES